MLSKQSIRGNIQIFINDELATKEQLIQLSKSWSDNEEILFRKLLKQGGRFKIKNQHYNILAEEQILNSKGQVDPNIVPMNYKDDNIDLNYLI
mgnify:FL=1|tara:strand:+ start:3756 stop:4034 length:279 start_codon:yes stop_codon:yes gene_type:complete